jgi:hypothetical protein
MCKSCTQKSLKNEVWYSERNKKISLSRKSYLENLSSEDKKSQIEKMANSISEKYSNRSEEWKEEWKKTCSKTSIEKWSNIDYKKKVSNKIRENNWSKRSDKEDIINKVISTKILKYGSLNYPGRCSKFLVNGLICDGTHEKYYIESLPIDKLPMKTNSIKTDFGYYKPDFEYVNFFVDVKSIFTLRVLLGFSSYSKTKKSNPKQLQKMKFISEKIKPIKIILIDLTQLKLLEFSMEEILSLKESEVNKNIFKRKDYAD